jgi:hypothetical protein
MTARRVLTLLVAMVLLGGCATTEQDNSSAANQAPPGQSTVTASAAPTVAQVIKPWQPGMVELGVNLYWEDSKADDNEVTRRKAERMLNYLVSLNVNSVALNFPFIMDSLTASTVKADSALTPSPDRVKIFLEEAAARKMRVVLRPLLDERRLLPSWRGQIEPANRAKWFASYEAFLRPYLQVAQETSVAELVLAVELNSMQSDQRWPSLIASVRKMFSGQITYSANFDAYQRKMTTPPVDNVGVDAYFSVAAPDNASVNQLTTAWEQWIGRYAGAQASSLVLHEVGIAAQNGAYHKPAQWGNTNVPTNLTVQNNWYAAVCRAAEQTKLAGLYFWNVRMHQNPGHEDPKQPDRMTFIDRPAAATMKDCYARLSQEHR